MRTHNTFKPTEVTQEIIRNEASADIGEVATKLYTQHAELGGREEMMQVEYLESEATVTAEGEGASYGGYFRSKDRLNDAIRDNDKQLEAASDWKDANYNELYEDAIRDAEDEGVELTILK